MNANEIKRWYKQAQSLLRRAPWPIDSLGITKRHRSFTWEDTPEGERQAWEATQAKAEHDEKLLLGHAEDIYQEARTLAEAFDIEWVAQFYLSLKDVDIEGLGPFNAAAYAMQAYFEYSLSYARDIVSTNQRGRLNSQEQNKWDDREKWMLGTMRTLRKRLLKERLTIEQAMGEQPPGSETEGPKNRGGRPEIIPADRAIQVDKWWQEFKRGPMPKEYKRPRLIRKGSADDFVAWGEFRKLENFPKNKSEVVACKKRYRDLQPPKLAKTNRTKRR